ncbi:GlyGly-CTERM sorting domain-containing protein [Photobacterium sanguinicancri]|uniref:GlyGly-CTERM sorting domain-containing protein n=1 Tax=Photobacterium sanguinicancri TaxID=875932 RepID=UPI003D0D33ED
MKYNKITASILTALILTSSSALAVEGGKVLDWTTENSKVETNCTGELLAGKWVLTAIHCGWDGKRPVGFSPKYREENQNTETKEIFDFPNGYTLGVDIGLWEQTARVDYDVINVLTPIKPAYGSTLGLKGFGGGKRELGYIELEGFDRPTVPNDPYLLFLRDIAGKGKPIGGDSGSAVTDSQNRIAAIFSADHGLGIYSASYIHGAKDFITSTINDWHYPTRLKTVDGINTVTVQSLHVNPTADTAYTEGDATITSGTCVGDNTIAPYATCTYDITSNGDEGKLILDNTTNAYVLINKKPPEPPKPAPKPDSKPAPDPQPTPDNGGGGGSFGVFALLSLGLLARKRR